LYDLQLSRQHCIIKYPQATSSVNWLSGEKTHVSRTVSVLVFRVPYSLVPWRRGQRWSLKHWFFRCLTNWHCW
jgi:hypothetical protein